jgi:hypothetical protein
MSRDFVIICHDAEEADAAARRLASVRSSEGAPLFEVDNRGCDLFVSLSWPSDIPEDFEHLVGNEVRRGLRREVAFVAIKNGEHNGIGYLVDTARRAGANESFPLADMPARIAEACGVRWARQGSP